MKKEPEGGKKPLDDRLWELDSIVHSLEAEAETELRRLEEKLLREGTSENLKEEFLQELKIFIETLSHIPKRLSEKKVLSKTTTETVEYFIETMRRFEKVATYLLGDIDRDDAQDNLENGDDFGGATKPVSPTDPVPVRAGGATRTIEEALEPPRDF
jgi:hypothetical protein